MLNWECSLSATMYSASSSPLATIWASAIIVAVYGRIGYAVITSTSAYFAACAAATQPFIRTVFFFLSITEVAIVYSARSARWRTQRWMSTLILNILRRPVTEISQFFRLPSVQSGGNGECRIHAHHAGIEVQFGHAFQASCRTLLDAYSAAFTVIDQNFVKTVGTHRAHDAWLRTYQIAVIAGVTGAAAETAAGFFDRLLFRVCLNHFILCLAPGCGRQQGLLDTGEVREIRHVHAVQIHDNVDWN